MSDSQQPNAFDYATATNGEVNELLAQTNGRIATMEFAGAIGYHINVAVGESDPEYLWKIALLQALDESLMEMMHVDADETNEARRQIKRELENWMDPLSAERVADLFERKLSELIEVQEYRSPDVGGEVTHE